MRKTGFLYDERFLLHETGHFHPEIPERLEAIYKGIQEAGLLSKLVRIKASLPELKWIESVHETEYIHRFGDACHAGASTFECTDNQICCDSYDTALLAVGGVLEAVDLVMKKEIDNVFCAVRPPGHHAETRAAMGFCYFNNVAIAARYIQKKWGISRIGIIDFDVHHGNGTQQIFEADPTVFYYSIHQHPSFAYPGTGREFEQGTGPGHGFTKNLPVMPGHGDEEYTSLVENNLNKDFAAFKPETILVSAGFDGHVDDEMSDIKLSTEWFSWMMKQIIKLSDQYADGRLISVLEGGYAIERLPELGRNHVEMLLADN